MKLSEHLTRWFDVRPNEARDVLLSFFGASSVISFLILSRSLREALYLSEFPVETLPYVIIGAAVLSVPSAGLFGRLMAGGNPRRTYVLFLAGLGVAVAVLLILLGRASSVVTVVFYLVTLLGSSLLTTGFWMVTSEQYSLRQAKRVFGLVGAGGTVGAMITGISIGPLTGRFSTIQVSFGLILLLAATALLQLSTPRSASAPYDEGQPSTGIREGLSLIVSRPHLRNIAIVVMVATMASTILDYQFKEIVSSRLTSDAELASFFGAFYGWTGVISLLVQVFVVSRLMSSVGVAVSLSVLPALLVAGSAGLVLAPTFFVATLARGADNSLRKSLHRSVLEYLYVPVAPDVRRKTKAFIDSVVDTAAGGIGAGVLFLWVTLAGWPSRYLSLWVMALSIAFIYFGLKTGGEYTRTVRDRLADGGEDLDTSDFDARSLLTVTLTRMDVQAELAKAGINLNDEGVASPSGEGPTETRGNGAEPVSALDRISSEDPAVIKRALEEIEEWDVSHIEALTRLLARKPFYAQAVDALLQVGEPALDHLIEVLLDENADFVIRRRIPRILSESDTPEAHRALLDALAAGRFEVRYRAAIALARRRDHGLAVTPGNWQEIVWRAVEREVSRDRPIWELQRILDGSEAGEDDFVGRRVDVRGELSLEHTFRQLSLVLDPAPVKMAFHGIVMEDENLKSLSLEYLEQVLPPRIRERLWPFIGDISEYQRLRSTRSVDEVVGELSQTGATLFGGTEERAALDEALRGHRRSTKKDKAGD